MLARKHATFGLPFYVRYVTYANMSKKRAGKSVATAAKSAAGPAMALSPAVFHLLSIFCILTAGGLVYANSFAVPFVLDDVTSILTNPLVKNFDFRLKTRILGDLSFALNYQLGGFEVAGYHVVNLLLHLLNACLVYSLVQMIFRTPLLAGIAGEKPGQESSAPVTIGFVAALIFVTHPLQTQAVTYLAQRVAVMATSFYLGALLCYAGSRLSSRRPAATGLLGLSLLLALAGVLAKENAVTIPLVILLFEVTFFRGELRSRLLPLVWYLLPLLAAPILLLGKIGFSADMLDEVGRLTAESGAPPRMTYLLTQFPVIVSYLRLFFFPAGQNLDHDFPLHNSLLQPPVILSILLLAAVVAAGIGSWLSARRATDARTGLLALPAFGIAWFFIALLVESSVIPIRDVMFEHRLYLPSVGLVTGLAAAGWRAVYRWLGSDTKKTAKGLLAVGCIIALLLGVATVQRNRVWQSEVTLWEDVVRKSPAKGRGYGALGHAYQRSGRLNDAEVAYRQAVRLSPTDHIALNNLGAIYLKQKRYDEAVRELLQVAKLSPTTAATRFNLGLAYAGLGRLQEAEASFEQALRLQPDYQAAAENLAVIRKFSGRARAPSP